MEKLPDIKQGVETITESSITRKILVAAPLIAGFLLFTDFVVLSGLVILSLVTPVLVRHLGIKMLGIEFVTLTTVLVALEMGAAAGALAGFLLMTAHMIAGQFSGAYILWVIPSYGVAGFIAGTVSMPVTTLGVGLAAGLNIFFTAATAGLTPEGLPYQIPHALGNIAFNAGLFIYVAPQLLAII